MKERMDSELKLGKYDYWNFITLRTVITFSWYTYETNMIKNPFKSVH